MITLDAFLVFLFAASLPVVYLLICRRWIESDPRQTPPSSAEEESHVHGACLTESKC
jgi:hypothetical protein